MNEENIVRYTKEELDEKIKRGQDETDWERLDAMSDDDIDYSDISPLDDSFWKNAKLIIPSNRRKSSISFKVDNEVLRWFKSRGKGYQSYMNAVLSAYIDAQKSP